MHLDFAADRKSTAEHLEPLISEILAAGADIHAVDETGSTPFSYLVGYSYRKSKVFPTGTFEMAGNRTKGRV